MDYNNLSLSELKDIAKNKGIVFGNIGKEKLIEKIEQYDLENVSNLIEMDNITKDIIKEDESAVEAFVDNDEKKEDVITEITNMVSDLSDYEESSQRDSNIEDIGLDEEVPCMSIVFGGLNYTSPLTGSKYRWKRIGDVEYLTVKELVSMNNSKPTFLNRPWIILQDIRAINKFRLMSKYEEVAKINNLKKLFASGDTKLIENIIDNALNSGMRDVIISKVRTMYNNGSLNNTHIIRLLEEKLKFDLVSD